MVTKLHICQWIHPQDGGQRNRHWFVGRHACLPSNRTRVLIKTLISEIDFKCLPILIDFDQTLFLLLSQSTTSLQFKSTTSSLTDRRRFPLSLPEVVGGVLSIRSDVIVLIVIRTGRLPASWQGVVFLFRIFWQFDVRRSFFFCRAGKTAFTAGITVRPD